MEIAGNCCFLLHGSCRKTIGYIDVPAVMWSSLGRKSSQTWRFIFRHEAKEFVFIKKNKVRFSQKKHGGIN